MSPSGSQLETEIWSAERIYEADRKYVIHSWSVQGALDPMVIGGGSGSWFWDRDGNRYLDFQSQLANLGLGYQHPRMIEAIKRQADRLCYIGPGVAEQSRSELAEALARLTPGDLTMSFFTTGGAAANENAVRLARHATGRPKVISRYRSYHGATASAISMSGDPRRWASEPGVPGVVRMLDPYPYRRPADDPANDMRHLEELLQHENPATIAAVIVEPISGANGIIYPPDDYLPALRRLCDQHGILLIFDEVVTAFGRTGAWFAADHWNVVPDILVTAKGLNSGYVPLGAITVSQALGEWLQTNMFWGGLTYSGHPIACASGVASLRIIEEEGLVEQSRLRGEQLGAGLRAMAERHPAIGEVRGRGLFYGVELVRSRETREPLVPYAASGAAAAPARELVDAAAARQLHIGLAHNVLRLIPPLIVTEDEVDLALSVLDEVLDVADRHSID